MRTWKRWAGVGAMLLVGLAVGLGTTLGPTVYTAWAGDGDRVAQGQSKAPGLLKKVDQIAKRVSKIRGLAIKKPIARGVMTKAQIRARIIKRIDQEYSPAELASEELSMKRMGLLPGNVNYKQLVIDLLTDEIAGFYDPWDQRLYIAGWQQKGMAGLEDSVMAHEIDHALQDQHFNLKSFMKTNKHNGDAVAARQALVEGDGMALMVEFMMPPTVSPWADDRVLRMMTSNVASMAGSKGLAAAPLVLREGLIFPYTAGLRFVVQFRKHHSWKKIDAIYRKPPLSTEHVLHPAKYKKYERPDAIKAMPVEALAGYKKIYDNVSGELGLSILARQHHIKRSVAETAAEGWGGDRIAIYTPPGHGGAVTGTVGIQYTVWDHTADAIEYYDAMVDALPSLARRGKRTIREQTRVEYKNADGVVSLERRGDAVLLIVGAPTDRADQVRTDVWKAWKVTRR